MARVSKAIVWLYLIALLVRPTPAAGESPEALAERLLIADANILTPYRLTLDTLDPRTYSPPSEFDIPRARAGGLDLAFMGILVPPGHQDLGEAREIAERGIDAMRSLIEASDELVLVTSVAEARESFSEKKLGIALALENGAPVGTSLEELRHFYDRGIRMITLVHARPNQIGDSSYAQHRPWRGLSPIGRVLVPELNRLGILIDVSHISDEAFDQVLELSTAPVIASHSGCRAFTPGWERNLDDGRIRRLAERGGVIHITFGGSFLSLELQDREQPVWDHVERQGLSINSTRGRAEARAFRKRNALAYATVEDVADQIDHVVELVGIDHVGLGSGFDGSGDSMPEGLRDVSGYPRLIAELQKRDYSVGDIEKIVSGNLLRVWAEVERHGAL